PISSTTPISAMMEKSCPTAHSAKMAPTPADGSVERIVNGCTKLSYSTPRRMYTVASAARMSQGWVASDSWNACAVPRNTPLMDAGGSSSATACETSRTASPNATPEAVLNETVAEGTIPSWAMLNGPTAGGSMRATALSGTIWPVSGERRWKY